MKAVRLWFILTIVGAAGSAQAVDQCVACHAKLERAELRAPVASAAADVHGKAGVTCRQCHGGDATATKGNQAHGEGFVASPRGEVAAEVCGGCHQPERVSWEKSPHARAEQQEGKANCVTCHGSHEVRPASSALIAEPLCSSCHPIDRPRRIWRALNEAETSIAQLDSELDGLPQLQDLKERLRSSRAELRGASHSLDLMALTRKAGGVQALVGELRAKAGPRLLGRRLGATVREVALWLVGALILTLALAVVARFAHRHRWGAWLTPGRWSAGVVVGATLTLVVVAAGSWRGYEYVQHSPSFCTSCHTMDTAYGAWAGSGHKNVECHTCHRPSLVSNLEQLWLYATTRPDEVIKHAEVDRAVCETCHNAKSSPSKWNAIESTAGHLVHAGKNQVPCVQCHATGIHRFKPPEQVCGDCHRGITLAAAGGMGELHCLQCHNFLADGKRPLRPDRAACLECHSRPEAGAPPMPGHAKLAVYNEGGKDAPMLWACSKCHNPHVKLKETSADCFKCHKDAVEGSPVHEIAAHKPGKTECVACHPPHVWKSEPAGCEKCHPGKVPKVPEE